MVACGVSTDSRVASCSIGSTAPDGSIFHSNTEHRNQVQRNQFQDLLYPTSIRPFENIIDNFGELFGQQRRNGIADLMVLLGASALEKIVVREGLNSFRFANGQAPATTNLLPGLQKPVQVAADCIIRALLFFGVQVSGRAGHPPPRNPAIPPPDPHHELPRLPYL